MKTTLERETLLTKAWYNSDTNVITIPELHVASKLRDGAEWEVRFNELLFCLKHMIPVDIKWRYSVLHETNDFSIFDMDTRARSAALEALIVDLKMTSDDAILLGSEAEKYFTEEIVRCSSPYAPLWMDRLKHAIEGGYLATGAYRFSTGKDLLTIKTMRRAELPPKDIQFVRF